MNTYINYKYIYYFYIQIIIYEKKYYKVKNIKYSAYIIKVLHY